MSILVSLEAQGQEAELRPDAVSFPVPLSSIFTVSFLGTEGMSGKMSGEGRCVLAEDFRAFGLWLLDSMHFGRVSLWQGHIKREVACLLEWRKERKRQKGDWEKIQVPGPYSW